MAGDGALENFVRRVIDRINDLTSARVAGVDDPVARAAAAPNNLLVDGRKLTVGIAVVGGVPPVDEDAGSVLVFVSVPPAECGGPRRVLHLLERELRVRLQRVLGLGGIHTDQQEGVAVRWRAGSCVDAYYIARPVTVHACVDHENKGAAHGEEARIVVEVHWRAQRGQEARSSTGHSKRCGTGLPLHLAFAALYSVYQWGRRAPLHQSPSSVRYVLSAFCDSVSYAQHSASGA